jgi:hypothetical protein
MSHFKKSKAKNFPELLQTALAEDQVYQEIYTRQQAVVTERNSLEARRDELHQQMKDRFTPADEAAAIASGKVSPGAADQNGGRESLGAISARIDVLNTALVQINAQLVAAKQEVSNRLYREEVLPEQMTVASKIIDDLLNLAATRAEENTLLFGLQSAGLTITGMPRASFAMFTSNFVSENLQLMQGLGFKPSAEQMTRLDGIKHAEAA